MIINDAKLSSVLNIQTNNKTESTNSTDGLLDELNSTGTTSADTTVEDTSNVDIVEISKEGLAQLQSSVKAADASTTDETSSTDTTTSSTDTTSSSSTATTSTTASAEDSSTAKLLSSLANSSTSSSASSTANLSQYSDYELKQMYIDGTITKTEYQDEINKRNVTNASSDSNNDYDSNIDSVQN